MDVPSYKDITRQLASSIAHELGDHWTVDTTRDAYDGVYLNGQAGATLFLVLLWSDKDRLVISGSYNVPDSHRLDRHEITVNRFRPPTAIVKEINRRLLPGYLVTLEKALQADADDKQAAADKAAVQARLMTAMPGAKLDAAGVNWFSNDHGYGDIRLYHDGSKGEVKIRDLTAAQIEAVLKVLA